MRDELRPKSRNRKLFVLAIACCGGIALGHWTLRKPGTNHLLLRARRWNVGAEDYQWLTNHGILYTQIHLPNVSGNRIVKCNVETGRVSLLRALKNCQRNFGLGKPRACCPPMAKS